MSAFQSNGRQLLPHLEGKSETSRSANSSNGHVNQYNHDNHQHLPLPGHWSLWAVASEESEVERKTVENSTPG
jgi:hypothetical protein